MTARVIARLETDDIWIGLAQPWCIFHCNRSEKWIEVYCPSVLCSNSLQVPHRHGDVVAVAAPRWLNPTTALTVPFYSRLAPLSRCIWGRAFFNVQCLFSVSVACAAVNMLCRKEKKICCFPFFFVWVCLVNKCHPPVTVSRWCCVSADEVTVLRWTQSMDLNVNVDLCLIFCIAGRFC